MNYGGQIEQDEMAKGCGTRARDEGEVQIATGTRECDRPLKTHGRNFLQDNINKIPPRCNSTQIFIYLQSHSTCFGCHSTNHQDFLINTELRCTQP